MNCNINIINPLDMKDLQSGDIKNILFKCLKYKLGNHKLLANVLNEIIKKDATQCEYYEYFHFTHNKYKQLVVERYNYHSIKIEQTLI